MALFLRPAGTAVVDCGGRDHLTDGTLAAERTFRRTIGVDAMEDLEAAPAGGAFVVVEGHPCGSAAKEAHAALRAVEGAFVTGGEPAVRAHESTATRRRDRPLDRGQAQGELAGEDVGENVAEQLCADPVRVAADALATPT